MLASPRFMTASSSSLAVFLALSLLSHLPGPPFPFALSICLLFTLFTKNSALKISKRRRCHGHRRLRSEQPSGVLFHFAVGVPVCHAPFAAVMYMVALTCLSTYSHMMRYGLIDVPIYVHTYVLVARRSPCWQTVAAYGHAWIRRSSGVTARKSGLLPYSQARCLVIPAGK